MRPWSWWSARRHEGAADLCVGQAVGDQPQHLGLPLGECASGGREPRAGGRPAGEVGDQPPGHRGGEQGVAGGHHADRVYQFGGGGVLEQEAAGAGPQRLIHVVVEVEGGEHQHPRPGRAGCVAEDLAGRLQAVHDRHSHVHQNDVGPQVPRQADRVRAVGGLAHHQQAGLGGEHRGEALPHHRLVVDDQAPGDPAAALRAGRGHGVSPTGSTAETTKPPSGAGPADSEPPSRATRSRIPVSP